MDSTYTNIKSEISALAQNYNKMVTDLKQRAIELTEAIAPIREERLKVLLTKQQREKYLEAYNNTREPAILETIKSITDEAKKISAFIHNQSRAYELFLSVQTELYGVISEKITNKKLNPIRAITKILGTVSNTDFALFQNATERTKLEIAQSKQKLEIIEKGIKTAQEQLKQTDPEKHELICQLENAEKELSKHKEMESSHLEYTEKYGAKLDFDGFCRYLYGDKSVSLLLHSLSKVDKDKLQQARLKIGEVAGKFITPDGNVITIPSVPEEDKGHYSPLLQGPGTNMLGMFRTEDFTDFNPVTRERTAHNNGYALSLLDSSFTPEEIKRNAELDADNPDRISKKKILVNQFKFDDRTTMVFDAVCEAFTQQIRPYTQETATGRRYKKEYSAEELEATRRVNITVKKYQELRGLADRKKVKEELKRAMALMRFANGSFDEPVVTEYTDTAGRKRTKRDIKHWDINYFEKKSTLLSTGDMDIYLTPTFAEYLATKYVMPMDNRLYSLQGRVGTKAYNMGKKILEHFNMNVGEPNANKISVKTLLKYTDLPAYEELKKTGYKASEKIIYPFEERLNALEDKGIIKSWEFITLDGNPPIELDYKTFINSVIVFEISPEYPDQTPRLEAKAKKIEEAKARKEKAIKKNMKKKKEAGQ